MPYMNRVKASESRFVHWYIIWHSFVIAAHRTEFAQPRPAPLNDFPLRDLGVDPKDPSRPAVY